jgi:hypothetical protein
MLLEPFFRCRRCQKALFGLLKYYASGVHFAVSKDPQLQQTQ